MMTLDSVYRHAVASGVYDSVYWSDGFKLTLAQKRRSPALENPRAYFTALTRAYLAENDDYPFDYQELQRVDSAGFHLAEQVYGSRELPKREVTLPPPEVLQWIKRDSMPLDPFYRKYLDADSIPVLASRFVCDSALLQARYIALEMMKKHPEIRNELMRYNVRIVIIGRHERVIDIPEFRVMPIWWPKTDWARKGKGFGPTAILPLMTCAENNIIKLPHGDSHWNESIMVHEFGHCVDFALRRSKKHRKWFGTELDSAFAAARDSGLWAGSYAISNAAEYFAEGTQAWFNTCRMKVPDKDGKHFRLKTREQLKGYDRRLYDLLARVYEPITLRGYHFDYEN